MEVAEEVVGEQVEEVVGAAVVSYLPPAMDGQQVPLLVDAEVQTGDFRLNIFLRDYHALFLATAGTHDLVDGWVRTASV